MKTTNLSQNFYDAKEAYTEAKKNFDEARENAKYSLVTLLPSRAEGVTAAELSASTGIDSHDIANLLSEFCYGSRYAIKKYILLNEDGTVDYDHKIIRRYPVRTYRKDS